jgi:2-C-methyl-D-erythritol 4-phosphate cytidylyltransferase
MWRLLYGLHSQALFEDPMSSSVHALIPAAGIGARAAGAVPKQYVPIGGVPMLSRTVAALCEVSALASVIVILAPEDRWGDGDVAHGLLARFGPRLRFACVGGATRAQSVVNGLHQLDPARADDWVLVHDAARPCVRPGTVRSMVAALLDDPVGGLLAVPVADTVKRADHEGRVASTVPRDGLWLAQTPQMFRKNLLEAAYASCPEATDEASAVEALGQSPRLVPGEISNFKVTFPGDFSIAERFLS